MLCQFLSIFFILKTFSLALHLLLSISYTLDLVSKQFKRTLSKVPTAFQVLFFASSSLFLFLFIIDFLWVLTCHGCQVLTHEWMWLGIQRCLMVAYYPWAVPDIEILVRLFLFIFANSLLDFFFLNKNLCFKKKKNFLGVGI